MGNVDVLANTDLMLYTLILSLQQGCDAEKTALRVDGNGCDEHLQF